MSPFATLAEACQEQIEAILGQPYSGLTTAANALMKETMPGPIRNKAGKMLRALALAEKLDRHFQVIGVMSVVTRYLRMPYSLMWLSALILLRPC